MYDADNTERDGREPLMLIAANAASVREALVLASGRAHLLGRRDDCDLRVHGMTVARRHAQVRVDDAGRAWVQDMHTTTGTYLDGVRVVPGAPVRLRAGDRLVLGEEAVVVTTPARGVAMVLAARRHEPNLPLVLRSGRAYDIGRARTAHISIQHGGISRTHARLEVYGPDRVRVVDLRSINGVLMDGAPVGGCAWITPRHVIQPGGASGVEVQLRRVDPAWAADDAIDLPGRPIPPQTTSRRHADGTPATCPDEASRREVPQSAPPMHHHAPPPPPDLSRAARSRQEPEPIGRLEVIEGPSVGARLALYDDRTVQLGRHPSSDLMLRSPTTGRAHATVQVRDGVVWIEGTTPGRVLVDGRRAEPGAPLQVSPGQRLYLADHVLVFVSAR